MEVKGTIVVDSLGELARLTFSKDMKKDDDDIETLRGMNNYPGMAERINILMRKFKEFRAQGWNVVITAHEGVDKIYAKGGMMGKKGDPPPEPMAIKGRPGMPGNSGPDEVMKAADNIFRTKVMGNEIVWCARPESMGPGAGNWEVKDRFNATAVKNGYLPNSYAAIEQLMLADPTLKRIWNPPYIWIIYGAPGTKKTRSILTFPKPIKLFDIDGSARALSAELADPTNQIELKEYNSETHTEYDRFLVDIISVLGNQTEISNIKRVLGVK